MTNDPAAGLPGTRKPWTRDATGPRSASAERELELRAYLRDYTAVIAGTPHPSLLLDHAWNVLAANAAYEDLFRDVRECPEAMPGQNFLRFALFHPDACTVLREHETSWCLPLLAQFSAALDAYERDATLRVIREDIARDPLMNAAYQQGLPLWMDRTGRAALDHDGAVRPVRHPDPAWGSTTCRVLTETPSTLRERGLTRLTLVLHPRAGTTAERAEAAPADRPVDRLADRRERPAAPPRLRVVPTGPAT
ncbi:MmyB family transcriptional regulator [Streptomyces boluensis]|uniref:MmyB-like transcription regulator ligand binding domain-containing protein n=1 Tax=Streptomyces boluensis TaxID=1775135 RepID=A0A964UQU8_9ACTN|nr:hypothetical protein [Streptomyces boluensis]NBE53748.1 hypothetical protein [Streptomyces boluensis]